MNNKIKVHKIGLIMAQVILAGSVLSSCQTATPVLPKPTSAPMVEPSLSAAGSNEVILTSGDWPPYVFEQETNPGPMAEIVIAAFKEAGLTARIVFYPWKRAEDEVRQGKAFAAFPYATTEERKKEFNFSEPMYIVKGKFFYNKKFHPDGMPFEKLEDLRSYKIGGLLGSWYEPSFKAAGLQVEYVAAIEQNLEKLSLGRIDLTIEEENSVWYLIRKDYPEQVDQFAMLEKPVEQPGVVNDLSLMVSRGYPKSAELLEKFNAGLAAIRANGIYQQILEKYQLAGQP